jgi:nitrite reductase (NO-forming)
MKGTALVRFLGLLVVIMVVGMACSASAAPRWTYPPAGGSGTGGSAAPTAPAASGAGGTSMPGMGDSMPGMGGSNAAGGSTVASGGTLEIQAYDLGFKPSQLSVAAAGSYQVKFVNTGAIQHNMTFADGTKIVAEAGQTATGNVNVPAAGITFLCDIPGHAQAGMTGAITVAGSGATAGSGGSSTGAASGSTAASTTPAKDPNAPPYSVYDPTAPALLTGTVHDVQFPIIERDMTVAEGYVVHVWTFGGTVPGPTIRVHLGDTVRVHLTNTTTMSHSIDFHASQTAMNHQMVEIKPGATFTYTFTASYAGVWMYHCGTAPTLQHIANGMFGMVIVEPRGGLPKVDRELAIVQSEWYLGGQGQIADYTKASAAAPAPDFVVFNGVANQYKDHPIQVQPKQRVRIFVLDAGPNIDSSFHIVGTIFDQVTKEGITLARGNAGGWGSQAVDLSPAQAAIIELTVPESGMYPMVTHAFNFVGRGAVGILMAGDGNPPTP